MFGDHGLCGLPEEGTYGKSPKCLGGNLGDFGGILQRSRFVFSCHDWVGTKISRCRLKRLVFRRHRVCFFTSRRRFRFGRLWQLRVRRAVRLRLVRFWKGWQTWLHGRLLRGHSGNRFRLCRRGF